MNNKQIPLILMHYYLIINKKSLFLENVDRTKAKLIELIIK